ncbi:MAG: hypothetical protein ACRC1F_02525 [Metamycoplasmataceae bacterium]
MATNYNALIKSEKNLKKMVVDFLDYSYETHSKLWNYIYSEEDGHKLIDSISINTKESEQKARDLVDECIWTISKDDPRANHLRFIISIIYCSKDIEKSISYSLSIAKIFVRKQISNEQILMIKKVVKNYLDLFSEYIEIYKKQKIKDVFDLTEKMYFDFIEHTHETTKKIRRELTKDDHELDYFPISQIIKSIESTLERIKSIFTNNISRDAS